MPNNVLIGWPATWIVIGAFVTISAASAEALMIANAPSAAVMVFVIFIFFPTTPLWPLDAKLAQRGCCPRQYARRTTWQRLWLGLNKSYERKHSTNAALLGESGGCSHECGAVCRRRNSLDDELTRGQFHRRREKR